MDFVLLILGLVLILTGLIGCIAPVIPGPPLSFIGMLLLHFTDWGPFDSNTLWILGVAAVVVTVLDNVVPIWGTKKFGGSKAGVWGSTIGLVVGLFFAPIGIIVGPFLGAFIGEMTQRQATTDKALKAAFGALIGFVLGIGMKLAVSGTITFYFFKEWLG
jgi:uncharacterized protein YqgC (DUF456 family)